MHHVLNVPVGKGYNFSTGNINQSLFGTLSVYKLIINNLVNDAKRNARFNELLTQCTENSDRAIFSDHTVLSAQKRLEIIERAEPANSAIANKYLKRSDGKLFLEPLPIDAHHDSGALDQAEDLRTISQQLIAKDHSLMQWLTQEVRVSYESKNAHRSMAARIMSQVLPLVPDGERPSDTRSEADFVEIPANRKRRRWNSLGSRKTKFERVFLHIGLGKTGTTSIQGALLDGAQTLAESCDLFFPTEFNLYRPFDGNHTLYMSSLFSQHPETLRDNILKGLTSPDAAAANNQKIQKLFERQFESSTQTRLLISAEGIGHFDGEGLRRLKTWLDQIADSIEVIACLRHPMHAVSAEIQQRLTIGRGLEDLYQRPPYYGYKSLLGKLERVFSRESITVYDYAQVLQNELGSVGAFLDQIGIEDVSWVKQKKRLNQAYSYEAVLLIDALNRLRPLVVNNERNPLRSHADLYQFMQIPGGKYSPPPEVYATLNELISPHMAWLEENYGLVLDSLNAGESAASTVPPNLSRESIDAIALQLSDYSNLMAAKK
jgi:hypothetical protein